MQRRVTRLQLDIDGFVLIDIDRNLLTAGEQVVLIEGVGVLDLLLVGPGNELHATGNLVRRRSR
jgi:hypothetical protein